MRTLFRPVEGWSGYSRYAAGVTVAVAIVGARIALNPVLGHQRDRHLFLLPAVMLAAWVGGFGPGCVASALCGIALSVFWTGPKFAAFPPMVTADVALFIAVGIAVCGLVESLRVARTHADAARAARDQLLAIVVHDLGNPLNVITLAATGLRRSTTDAPVLRIAERIDRAATRMSRLVRDLQDASQIERGTLTVNAVPEAVASLLRDVVDEFALPLQAKNVRLETRPTSPELTVCADRNRLAQVLGNLVGNALKFTPAGGSVAVQVDEQGDGVVFEVKDTGPGIASEQVPHVFERYWKGTNGGTGLGLFIANGIVRAHGGRLEVRSAPGMGATFFFSIPRARFGVATEGPVVPCHGVTS